MAFCPKCGKEVSTGSAFCPSCGAQLQVGSAQPQAQAAPVQFLGGHAPQERVQLAQPAVLAAAVAQVVPDPVMLRSGVAGVPQLFGVTAWIERFDAGIAPSERRSGREKAGRKRSDGFAGNLSLGK